MYDKSHAFAWLLVPLRNNLSVVVLALLILTLVLAVLLILILILVVLLVLVLILIVLLILVLILIVLLILVLILVIHHYTAFSQQILEGSRGRSHPYSQ